MTDVQPFRALRYDTSRVCLEDVLAPVYDVVAAEDRASFWDRHPNNALRLVLTRDAADEHATDYSDVAGRLAQWRSEGVLARDETPAYYVLRQRFSAPDGRALERLGFFGALQLEEYAARIVRPHERTMAGPKADRLKILRATQTNLSSVFMLYEDRDDKLKPIFESALRDPSALVARDSGDVEQTIVPLREPSAVAQVAAFMAEHPVVIADGHHRYETALAYRDEQRAAGTSAGHPSARLLTYFANAYAPGNLLLPIHRLVVAPPTAQGDAWQALTDAGWTSEEVRVENEAAIPDVLETHLAPLEDRYAFAADDASGRLVIWSRPAGAELSVRVIHDEVLARVFGIDAEAVRSGAVAFPKSAAQTAKDVREGRGRVALYLNPLSPDDVFRVTEAGETLPQKSTFFHPKLPTGLLFRSLEAE
ncbi:MAG: DUF1015 domain-containing protein [bacterium]|nr:DUF1015 domain-containing protein [bacterium]MCP5070807.1 DUF1015 domain-containing protein [bacterium]